ncbi:diguanylate cyclase [Vibrio lentus]|uniref:GGDEF domain-containing protein n=2 Tax=Vibrio lentus TaxID=136468 RepID=A0AA45A8A0_9VIBR|nr:LapD/MoxY N-terminal periplasmic domain-containing protein [Vibrio lentus]MCB5358441.1 diguanylate cyclase [Vibrio lentus]MCB5448909.1 diguanylate cyclase [Vibrio lentus]MCB5460796.1 diguanylate cyclase [Vibrio lentus]MCC5484601.1 diguanylate cyclase [Vibrio lentus]MCC5487701.1 diguanylate cyclase [Vibrio lentus]
MTLYRMLLTGLSTTLLLLTLLLTFINFAASKRHLIEQQEIELNNTAHSLSFALKPVINQKSRSHVESVVNSMFDANFYDSLGISFTDNRPQINFKWESQSHFVPSWFMQLFAIPEIQKSVEITSGWQHQATLIIKTSPQFTYIKLWNTTVAFVLIGGLFNLLAIAIFALYLKKVLVPLKELTSHLNANPTTRTYQPTMNTRVSEMTALIRAYNLMARQNHTLIDSLESKTAYLHRTAYIDTVTGLYNRQYLLDILEGYLSLNIHEGSLMVFQIRQLSELKKQRRFSELNEHAEQIADLFNNSTSETFILARLNDTEFALLQRGAHIQSVPQTFDLLNQHIDRFYKQPTYSNGLRSHVAVLLKLKYFSNTNYLLTALEQKIQIQKNAVSSIH